MTITLPIIYPTWVGHLLHVDPHSYIFVGLYVNNGVVDHILNVDEPEGEVFSVDAVTTSGPWTPVSEIKVKSMLQLFKASHCKMLQRL